MVAPLPDCWTPLPSPNFPAMETLRFRAFLSILIVASAGLWSACYRASAQPSDSPPPPKITVADVISRDVTEWDEFTGRLEAVNSVAIRPRVSGYIAAARFDEGAMVKKGD